jgi:hypothetical protein
MPGTMRSLRALKAACWASDPEAQRAGNGHLTVATSPALQKPAASLRRVGLRLAVVSDRGMSAGPGCWLAMR